MEVQEALRLKLLADPVLAVLIGDRIGAQAGIQGDQLPLIRYEVGDRSQAMSVAGPINLHSCTVQYSCDADSYPEAEAIAKRARLLIGFQGELSAGLITVAGIFDGDTGEDQYEGPVHATGQGVHTIVVPLEVWYGRG